MATRAFIVFLLAGALAALAGPASAFDGQRKGFMIGAGLGPGMSSFSQDFTLGGITTSGSETKWGLATEFRIGYGPTDQLVLFYNNRVNWFGIQNANGQDVTIADGVGLVSGAWFFAPEAKSFYVVGGLGYSAWSTPFESNTRNSYGFGVLGGGGYQFSKLFSAELSVSWSNPTDSDQLAKLETKSVAVRATVNIVGY